MHKANHKPKNRVDFLFKSIKRLTEDKSLALRIFAGSLALLIFSSILIELFVVRETNNKYDLSKYEGTLLSKPIDLYADKLQLDKKTGGYTYNSGYSAS
ncbi:MAG: hypothetical protein AAB914_04620, partial [Patescibacteria group bacterium]